jgi:hypothetical protein
LVPGVGKCIWEPVRQVDWNGLNFDFEKRGISILPRRLESMLAHATGLQMVWPAVSFREISKLVGQLMSMHPVLQGVEQLKTRKLQSIVNIKHYKGCSWDATIRADYEPLIVLAQEEIRFWIANIHRKNFRPFEITPKNCVAWVDASDYAIAGLAANIDSTSSVPVTMDNWLLDPNLAYRRLRNRAELQVDYLPWSMRTFTVVRDEFDLDPHKVNKLVITHRNLQYYERVVDSNERELKAALLLLQSCGTMFANRSMTLHFDNHNAAIICTKGSLKIRLQDYAEQIFDIAEKHGISLNTVWIPRDLNNVADLLSKTVDYHDYSVTDEFFKLISPPATGRERISPPVLSAPCCLCTAGRKNRFSTLAIVYSPVYCWYCVLSVRWSPP